MEKSDLYKLNKDVLIILIEQIQDKLKKEIDMRDDILNVSQVEYSRCCHPDCYAFSIRRGFELLKCDQCSLCFCKKHNFDRIFANKCLTCQYSS